MYNLEYLGSSVIIILSLIVFTFLMFKYWQLLIRKVKKYRNILFILRFLSILFILFLIIDPLIKWNEKKNIPQNIDIFFDLSESMFVHSKKYNIDFNDIQNSIEEWGYKNNLQLDFFKFGKNINILDNFNESEGITNFNDIHDFILFEQTDQLLLITDGKATEGRDIKDIIYDRNRPIHTLGVGPIQIEQDIKINDIIIPQYLLEDSTSLLIKTESQLHEKYTTVFKIQNELNENIYNKKIIFESGNQFLDIKIKIPSSSIYGLNIANIIPIENERDIHNNSYSFRGGILEPNIEVLLISGSLSGNSFLISQTLSKIDNISLQHYYRKNYNDWSQDFILKDESNIKMIVLDDFPIYKNDEETFQKIFNYSSDENVPIIYIEGPSFNLIAAELINDTYPNFTSMIADRKKLINIDSQSLWKERLEIELDNFPPQNRNFKWILDKRSLLSYQDGSVMLGNADMLYLLSIPNLVKNHFQLLSINGSILTDLLHKIFMYGLYGSDSMLAITTDRNVYNKGESIDISLHIPDGIDLNDFIVYSIVDNDTLELQCTSEIWKRTSVDCSFLLENAGEYIFYGKALRFDDKEIYTENRSVFVRDMNVEMKELIQEQQSLIELSYKTKGMYQPIDSLDVMLESIDITPIPSVVKHQISGIKIQNYWWIIILLLSFEWFLRKKVRIL